MSKYRAAWLSIIIFSAASAWAHGPWPTDEEIVTIFMVANQIDFDAGTLAKSKAISKEVKEFALSATTDHARSNQATSELMKQMHLSLQPSPTSRRLKQRGDQNLASLDKLSGSVFDRAYIEYEVAFHQAVLGAVDNTLIPNAIKDRLKAFLVDARQVFVEHLEHARRLQNSILQP